MNNSERLSKISFIGLLVVLGTVVATMGCSSDGGCSFNACGGDAVGNWRLVKACAPDSDIDTCSEGRLTYGLGDSAGMVMVRSDMTYSSSIMFKGMGSATVPGSCSSNFSSCSAVATYAEQTLGFSSVTCQGTPASGCSCSYPINDSSTDSGTWAASGNQVTLSGQGGTMVADYCRQGTTFTIKLSNGPILTFAPM